MALKKSTVAAPSSSLTDNAAASAKRAEAQRKQARTVAKQQQAAQRIASSTAELASAITEASSAREQLSKASASIAAGAEQSSSSCQESLAAINQVNQSLKTQQEVITESKERSDILQTLIENVSNEISNLVDNIGTASDKQTASVAMMSELEQLASNIGETVKQVTRIADQTNLLALNVAIEAGRAGQHGKGFTVVADTVRSLAEVSEKSALDIAAQIERIQQQSRQVSDSVQESATTALEEVEKGRLVSSQLQQILIDIKGISTSSDELLGSADQMFAASRDILKGSEEIASAAEEQSAAAEQVVKTIEQQGIALTTAEQSSQDLESVADDLKNSSDISKSAEDVASSSEELSSSIEEINRAASEISAAISEISRGAETAAAAVPKQRRPRQKNLLRL